MTNFTISAAVCSIFRRMMDELHSCGVDLGPRPLIAQIIVSRAREDIIDTVGEIHAASVNDELRLNT